MTSLCGHGKVAQGSQTSYMESQGSKYKCSSEQNATPALELSQQGITSVWLQIQGMGCRSHFSLGRVLRPYCTRACEMGGVAGIFRKQYAMLSQSGKLSAYVGIF